MAKWDYLLEADKRLRNLERGANGKTPDNLAVKAYIKALSRVSPNDALRTLIGEFNVLPGIHVTYRFEPEEESIEGSTTYQNIIDWTYKELKKGNMYAWCRGHVRVEWDAPTVYRGDSYLGNISARNRKDAEEIMSDLVPDAVNDLVGKIPGGPTSPRILPSSGSLAGRDTARMIKDYVDGKENIDWAVYD